MNNCLCEILAAAVVCSTVTSACMADNNDVYSQHGFWAQKPTISAVVPEDFVIMPWGWTPGNEKSIKEIKDCGFNLAGFVTPEYVKVAQKAGLKCFVDDYRISSAVDNLGISDSEIEKIIQTAVAPLKNNPAVFGYYIKDEPGSNQYSSLSRWKNALAKEDPKAVAYINLLPIGAQDGGAKSYDEYLDKFASTVKPTFISFDHYTIDEKGNMDSSFYTNLEAVRKAAFKHNIAFWNIIQGCGFANLADPTLSSLSVQAYSTLAYGGRGICYFTYYTPLIEHFHNAAIDQFLNKTQTWDMVRDVNFQMHQLMPTYLKLKNVNVFHCPNVPDGCSGIETSRYISEVKGGDYLVGEFEGPNGTPYVMLVNKSIHSGSVIDIKFKESGTVMKTSAYTGLTVPATIGDWLAPGQGILLSISK